MKLGTTTVSMLAFLLMCGIASAANAQMSSATPPTPGCANGFAAMLPAVALEPSEQTALACGACSVPACQGMFVGDICGWSLGQFYTCGVVNSCAGMGLEGPGRFCDCPGNY